MIIYSVRYLFVFFDGCEIITTIRIPPTRCTVLIYPIGRAMGEIQNQRFLIRSSKEWDYRLFLYVFLLSGFGA